jgi:hypothetical protein
MTKPKHPGGRPRFPDETARRNHTSFRVSPADLALVSRVAAETGLDVSEVWRAAVRRWAKALGL